MCSSVSVFYNSSGVARCKNYSTYPKLASFNLKVVNGLSAPVKQPFKMHEKSLLHHTFIEAKNALTAQDSTS